jgi:hypothetical protein
LALAAAVVVILFAAAAVYEKEYGNYEKYAVVNFFAFTVVIIIIAPEFAA